MGKVKKKKNFNIVSWLEMFFCRSSEAISNRHQSFDGLPSERRCFMLLRFLIFGRFIFPFGTFLRIVNFSLDSRVGIYSDKT